MMKQLSILICLAFFSVKANTQCNTCATLKNFQSDYCYTHPDFPGICAHFGEKTPVVILEGTGVAGGNKEIKLPDSLMAKASWLINLSNDKMAKLTVAEALLLEKAIPAWAGEKQFLGMTYTASGLGIKITTQGTGKKPESGKSVTVHYKGTLLNGTEFDNSFKRGQPFSTKIGVGQVIKGWDEGIMLLNVGSKAILKIPAEMGYGGRPMGSIPANSTLVFEVELISAE